MDREHPIPQEVSTYEFRLVGDMTIKQFMQVAAGALIALVIYSSNMEPYVKWPLILISFLSGVALAFFPIEDRPLSTWIVLFIKAIYSPTIYVWDKNARKYNYFLPETDEAANQPLPTPTNAASVAPTSPALSAVQPEEQSKLDTQEQEFLTKVNAQFTTPKISQPANTSSPSTNPAPTQAQETAVPVSVPNVNQINIPNTTSSAPSPAQTVARPDVKIPYAAAPEIEIKPKETVFVNQLPVDSQTQTQVGGEITPLATAPQQPTVSATFSPDASPPAPPTMPNVVVGQVLTPEGGIVDGAILEIKDEQGRSVRALRSNGLGHFMIVTPLTVGKYTIAAEKEGYNFDPVSVEVADRIIPPIAIWAKGQNQES